MATLMPTWAFDDSLIPDPHGRAARMLRFADLLRHPKADPRDRRPLLHRWQRRIVERIYGPSDEAGQRQVKTVFMLLPRGARKTTLTSVLALGHTIGPEQRRGGECISAASDRTQARRAFDEAREMVLEDPILMEATRVRDTMSRIEHDKSRSVYVAIAADGDAQHGGTPLLVLADELHVWKGFDLWNALSTGASKTRGSLKIITTTAGQKASGVCWELYQYARRVAADPERDPSFLPILFQADPDADWLDEALWHEVNPGLANGFPDIGELRAESLPARESPVLREAFKQVHLNIWHEGGASNWIDMPVYDEGETSPAEAAEWTKEDRPAWIGVDLSKSYDLTAVVAVLRDPDGGFTAETRAFLPETAFRQRVEELPDLPLTQWRDQGILTVVRGDLIDEATIEAAIRELWQAHDVEEVRFDPKFAARMMARLREEGINAVECPPTRLVMGPFYAELQKAILARRFRHGGNPVLRWCIQSAHVDLGETGLPFASKKKSTGSIDALVAAAMAIGGAAGRPRTASIFDDPAFDPSLLVL